MSIQKKPARSIACPPSQGGAFKALLTEHDYLKAVEDAYFAQGRNDTSMLPRVNLDIPRTKGSLKVLMGTLPGKHIGGGLLYSGG